MSELLHLDGADRAASKHNCVRDGDVVGASITLVPIANLFLVPFTRDAVYVSRPLCEGAVSPTLACYTADL